MKRSSIAVALVATLAMVGNAVAVDVNWESGTGEWDLGNWSDGTTTDTAFVLFGRDSGWSGGGAFAGAPVNPVAVIGTGDNVLYDGGIVGDFRWRAREAANGGEVRVEGGGKFEIRSSAAEDGEWTQFDAARFTVTGAGSEMNRTATGSTVNGGVFTFGSWKSYDGMQTEIKVLDRAKFTNAGQLWFGAYNDSDRIDISMEIGAGAQVTSTGGLAQGVSLDDTAGEGLEGDIDLIYNVDERTPDLQADPPFEGGTGLTQLNNYSINFTGHGAALKVGVNGIRVQTETEPTVWTSELATAASLHTAGILQHNGGAVVGAMGDTFSVRGTPGATDYRIAQITGAGQGGAFQSDINGDLFVDGSDALELLNNFGKTGADAVLANGDIVDDGFIDGLDALIMQDDLNTAYDITARPGNAVALYDPRTGYLEVAVDNVTNWFIESLSGGMTGQDSAADVLPAGGGVYSGNQLRVGETSFGGPFSYNDGLSSLVLGLVAQPGLTDLTIRFNDLVGGAQFGTVQVVPEPASLALLGLGLCGVLASRRRLAA